MSGREWLALAAVAAVLAVLLLRRLFGWAVVQEHEAGLLYKDGRFQRQLAAGRHLLRRWRQRLDTIDLRSRDLIVSGQEVMSADRIAVKLTVHVVWKVTDPRQMVQARAEAGQAVYLAVQSGLREVVAGRALDDLVAARGELDLQLAQAARDRAGGLGVEIVSVALRDLMLPTNLKRAYAGVLEARKEAERRLELARGEQAVLRSLANSARLLQEHPGLVQARMLQALEGGGNTIAYGVPPQAAAEPTAKG